MGETAPQKPEEFETNLQPGLDEDIERALGDIASLKASASQPDHVLREFGPVLRLVTGEKVLRVPVGNIAEYVNKRLEDQRNGMIPYASRDGLRRSILGVLNEARDALVEAQETAVTPEDNAEPPDPRLNAQSVTPPQVNG